MPDEIIDNANKILNDFEANSKKKKTDKIQLSMDFDEPKKEEKSLKEALKDIDPLNMTPIEALKMLSKWKSSLMGK